MTRRRREHDRRHTERTLLAALIILGVAFIAMLALPDPKTPAPIPQQAPDLADRHVVAQTVSRSAPRVAPPAPSTRRGGAHQDTSDDGKRIGEVKQPVVAGFTTVQLCIREAESGGDYRAENPESSASGAWQFIDSTWESVTGLPAPASAYPRDVQDAAFLELWADGAGAGHWVTAAGCGA